MSSTEKGTIFENKVHQILVELIEKNELGISGNYYRIYHQKEFYSYLRKSNIKIDVAIEFYRKEGVNPAFYILVECKDYNHPVPINDLEEFYAKSQQILHANFKCMLFTTSSLQQAAYNYALSTGMAVVRILDDDSRMWLIERTNKNLTTSEGNSTVINVSTALTNEYYVNSRNDTFATYNYKAFLSIEEVFHELIQSLESEATSS